MKVSSKAHLENIHYIWPWGMNACLNQHALYFQTEKLYAGFSNQICCGLCNSWVCSGLKEQKQSDHPPQESADLVDISLFHFNSNFFGPIVYSKHLKGIFIQLIHLAYYNQMHPRECTVRNIICIFLALSKRMS